MKAKKKKGTQIENGELRNEAQCAVRDWYGNGRGDSDFASFVESTIGFIADDEDVAAQLIDELDQRIPDMYRANCAEPDLNLKGELVSLESFRSILTALQAGQ